MCFDSICFNTCHFNLFVINNQLKFRKILYLDMNRYTLLMMHSTHSKQITIAQQNYKHFDKQCKLCTKIGRTSARWKRCFDRYHITDQTVYIYIYIYIWQCPIMFGSMRKIREKNTKSSTSGWAHSENNGLHGSDYSHLPKAKPGQPCSQPAGSPALAAKPTSKANLNQLPASQPTSQPAKPPAGSKQRRQPIPIFSLRSFMVFSSIIDFFPT